MTEKIIALESLIPMDLFTDCFALRIDLAYARHDNLLFGEVIYHKNARLWLHKDLAKIVLLASKLTTHAQDLRMILHDGLRTIEAQNMMLKTQRVKDNPHWLKEPRLLSTPGSGGHPRGMAIDISLETQNGQKLDMGTAFDFLAENSSPAHNPAHRAYKHKDEITKNRALLDRAMEQATEQLNLNLRPLPEEWWDFRLPPNITNQYAPLSEADLPLQMRMTESKANNTAPDDFPEEHFRALKQTLLAEIAPHLDI